MEDISNVGQTDSIDAFDDSVIEYKVEKAPLLLETPYLLKVNLCSDDNSYQLPDVFFGLDGDDCYIYMRFKIEIIWVMI